MCWFALTFLPWVHHCDKVEEPAMYLADSMPYFMVQLASSSFPPICPMLYCRSWNAMNLDTHTCRAGKRNRTLHFHDSSV
jgi:hypothetical protein